MGGKSAPGGTPRWEGPPTTLHGDLYARHLLVDRGRLIGVIDWGDLMAGDPAVDLTVAVTFLPRAARASFEMVRAGLWALAGARAPEVVT